MQTLHPTRFDHGKILAQTSLPGIQIPQGTSVKGLEDMLAPSGADLLINTIRERRFVEPMESISHSNVDIDVITEENDIALAPKIRPEHRWIEWDLWSNEQILLRDRVLGQLVDTRTLPLLSGHSKSTRLTCERWTTQSTYETCVWAHIGQNLYLGVPIRETEAGRWRVEAGKPSQLMRQDHSKGDERIYCSHMTIEGKRKHAAGGYFAEWLRKNDVFEKEHIMDSGDEWIVDIEPLLQKRIREASL